MRDQVAATLPVRVRSIRPRLTVGQQDGEYGPRLFAREPDECCALRKVEPLERALADYDAWAAGLRRDESPTRANTPVVHFEAARGKVKVNPLAAWTQQDVDAYIARWNVPVNPLLRPGVRAPSGAGHAPAGPRPGRTHGPAGGHCSTRPNADCTHERRGCRGAGRSRQPASEGGADHPRTRSRGERRAARAGRAYRLSGPRRTASGRGARRAGRRGCAERRSGAPAAHLRPITARWTCPRRWPRLAKRECGCRYAGRTCSARSPVGCPPPSWPGCADGWTSWESTTTPWRCSPPAHATTMPAGGRARGRGGARRGAGCGVPGGVRLWDPAHAREVTARPAGRRRPSRGVRSVLPRHRACSTTARPPRPVRLVRWRWRSRSVLHRSSPS